MKAPWNVEIVGIYPIEFSEIWLDGYMTRCYGPNTAYESNEQYRVQRESWKEWVPDVMSALFLIELAFDGQLTSLPNFCVAQEENPGDYTQVMYDERWLTADGNVVISNHVFPAPTAARARLAFFLHYVDLKKPIHGPWGRLYLPQPVPLPERLSRLMPYDPPT